MGLYGNFTQSFPNYGQNTSYKTNNQFNVVHFEFLDLSQFLRLYPNSCAPAPALCENLEKLDISLLLTKIVKIRCKTLIIFNERDLLLGRNCFFMAKDKFKKTRTFFTVRHVNEKISHPHLATCLIENENNSNTCSRKN